MIKRENGFKEANGKINAIRQHRLSSNDFISFGGLFSVFLELKSRKKGHSQAVIKSRFPLMRIQEFYF